MRKRYNENLHIWENDAQIAAVIKGDCNVYAFVSFLYFTFKDSFIYSLEKK